MTPVELLFSLTSYCAAYPHAMLFPCHLISSFLFQTAGQAMTPMESLFSLNIDARLDR